MEIAFKIIILLILLAVFSVKNYSIFCIVFLLLLSETNSRNEYNYI